MATTTYELHELGSRVGAWCDRCGAWAAVTTSVGVVDSQTLELLAAYEVLVCTICRFEEVTR